MIREEINTIRSGRSELRKFGITMGVVFLLLAGFSWWRGREYYFCFLGLSTACIFCGLVVPFVLKPIHKFWMALAILMSWLMTRVILGILFYVGITPVCLLARLFGKDFLGLRYDTTASNSYWIPKEKVKDKNSYEKQF